MTLCRALCERLLGRQKLHLTTSLSQQHTGAKAGISEQTAHKIHKELLVQVIDPIISNGLFTDKIKLCFSTAKGERITLCSKVLKLLHRFSRLHDCCFSTQQVISPLWFWVFLHTSGVFFMCRMVFFIVSEVPVVGEFQC